MVKAAVVAYRLAGAIALLVSTTALAQAQQGENGRDRQSIRSDSVVSKGPATAKEGQAVTLDLRGATLADILREIGRQGGIELVYSKAVVPLDRRISLKIVGMPALQALTTALQGLDVSVQRSGRAWLLVPKRHSGVMVPRGALTGRITNTKTGEAVARAEVLLEKTAWRTTTDTTGRYSLTQVDTGRYTLTVRRLGFTKQSRLVTVRENQTDTVDIAFAPAVARLDELVTTATGPQRRLDIANDVTTINADSVMRTAPIRSVTDLLDGRVPGLIVQRTSGAPGDPARLRLRGASSPLRSNDPVVVVDGIRVYAEQSAARSANLASSSYATPSPLDYIDPNSIEKIEVLKGPSAATLYGQDAANGVIVITTKRGRAGPASWTANADLGQTRMAGNYPDLLLRAGHSLYDNTFMLCPITGINGGGFNLDPCVGDSLVKFQVLNDPALTVLSHGNRTALSLGVSGGSSALTYMISGSFADEAGLFKLPTYEADHYLTLLGVAPPDWMLRPQHLKQWGVTSSITARLGAKADVTLGTVLTRTVQQRSSLEQQLGALMTTYLDRISGKYYRASFTTRWDPLEVYTGDLLTSYYERATATATALTPSLTMMWRPRTWLTVTSDAGLNVIHRADQVYFPRGPARGIGDIDGIGAIDSTGYVGNGQGTSVVSTVNVRANAQAPLSHGFRFRFAAGLNYAGTTANDLSARTKNLPPGSSLQGIEADGVPIQMAASDATFGWYAEPSIGNDKLNFTSGLRLDGGSSYGGSTSGFSLPKFPKLGFSYVISDEPWFPLKALLQTFRVRLAYGRASRQPGLTDRLRLYAVPTQEFIDSQAQTGIVLQTLGNTEVRPERSTEFEGGFDADLWDSRLTLSVSGYRKSTDDALLAVPVAPSVYGGGVTTIKNIGLIRNTGLELAMTAHLVRSGPVSWLTQFQLFQDRSVVVKLGPGVQPFYADGQENASGIRVAAGYPLFGRWSKPILGYADANGNKILESGEFQLGDTAVYVGATLPNYTANINMTVTLWRALTVNAGLQYEDGLSQRNTTAVGLSVFSRGQQDPASSLAEQAATVNLMGANPPTDYNWIQTVSTTRFNNLSVSYRVPAAAARLLRTRTLDIALQGSNLALWTNYRGLDPNVNAFNTGNNVSDTGILPRPRTWQVQIHATY